MILFLIIVGIVVLSIFWQIIVDQKIDKYWLYKKKYPEAISSIERKMRSVNLTDKKMRIQIGKMYESQIQSEEREVVEQQFKECIKNNPERNAFYYSYALKFYLDKISASRSMYDKPNDLGLNIKKIIVRELSSLDIYIRRTVEDTYSSMSNKFPVALEIYEYQHKNYSKFQIVVHEKDVEKLNEIVKEKNQTFEDIKAKCPHLDLFIETYGLNPEKGDRLQLLNNVIDNVELAERFEKHLILLQDIKEVNSKVAKSIKDLGICNRCSYETFLDNDKKIALPISHYFCRALVDDVDVVQGALKPLRNDKIKYKQDIQDKIFKILSIIKQHANKPDIYIFNDEVKEVDESSISIKPYFLFNNVIERIEEELETTVFTSLSSFEELTINFELGGNLTLNIISPFLMAGEETKISNRLLRLFKSDFPHINFISYTKVLSEIELENVQRKKEEELHKLEILKNDLENFNSKLNIWDKIHSLPYFSFYYYYPTTCDWEATTHDWDIRNLVWNFKFNPINREINDFDYSNKVEADGRVLADLKYALLQIFDKEELGRITFFCVPASTQEVNERRYAKFSQNVCNELGMINAYKYLNFVQDATGAKHLGGEGNKVLNIDNKFFKNKIVIIFDDIITTGNSILKFKELLEDVGAHVIAALSIGKTKHEKQGIHPINLISSNVDF